MRDLLLKGVLPFPGNALFEKYNDIANDGAAEALICKYWRTVWNNYLNNKETNSLFWYEQLGGQMFNDVVRRLSHHGWIISTSLTGRKWADVKLCTDKLLEYVSVDELEDVKAEYKYQKYAMDYSESTLIDKVRQNGEVKETGLVRKGFCKAGNSEFGYDMDMLSKYEDAVISNINKSMDKIKSMYPDMKTSYSSYGEVSTGLYEWHKANSMEVFTTGDSYSDSRGRQISSCLNKVTNPISNKDFRSCLIIPK